MCVNHPHLCVCVKVADVWDGNGELRGSEETRGGRYRQPYLPQSGLLVLGGRE